jgi:hypothetical protein
MAAISELATQITRSVKRLPAKQMREVLNFIGYLENPEEGWLAPSRFPYLCQSR